MAWVFSRDFLDNQKLTYVGVCFRESESGKDRKLPKLVVGVLVFQELFRRSVFSGRSRAKIKLWFSLRNLFLQTRIAILEMSCSQPDSSR